MASAWDRLPTDTALTRTRRLDAVVLAWEEGGRSTTPFGWLVAAVFAAAGFGSTWMGWLGAGELFRDPLVTLLTGLPWVLAAGVAAVLLLLRHAVTRPRRRRLTLRPVGLDLGETTLEWGSLPRLTLDEDADGTYELLAGRRVLARRIGYAEARAIVEAIDEARPDELGEVDEEGLRAVRGVVGSTGRG